MITPEDGPTPEMVETSGSREERLDEAVAKYLLAKRSDRSEVARKILERSPDLRPELESFFAEHEKMDARARTYRVSSAASDLVGETIGGCEILRVVGYGAMGVVYEAWQKRAARRVALKVLPKELVPGKQLEERFDREGKLAGALSHPCVCPVHDVGVDSGYRFIVMQFVDGETLGDRIEASRAAGRTCCRVTPDSRPAGRGGETSRENERGAKDLIEVVTLFRKLATALHSTHEKNVLHRDIKPSNIMVRYDDGEPVIVDFGLARQESFEASALTESGSVVGTLGYMPPEQIRGKQDQVDRRSDVYALGVTLYECLTLQRPFPGENRHELAQRILREPPPDCCQFNPHIPRDLKVVVEKAIDKDPSRRYPTARDLADDLGRYLRHEPVEARPAGCVLRLRRWSMRHPALATVNASVVLGLLVSLFFVWELSRRQDALERSHVQTLVAAESASVPSLIGRLEREGILRRLEPRLKEAMGEPTDHSKEELHLALALAILDPSWSDYILERLATATPEETQAAAKVAARHGIELSSQLERVMDDRDRSSSERLRSFVALSELGDPERLLTWIGEFSHWLQQEPRHFTESWLGMIRDEIRDPLREHFRKDRDPPRSDLEREFAAWAIAVMSRDDLRFLVDQVKEGEGLVLKFAVEELQRYDPVTAANLINERLTGALPDTSDEARKDGVAREQARLAAALLAIAPNLAAAERAWDLFGHSRDPRIRTFLLSLLVPAGVSAVAISSRLDSERDPSARYALTLALGEFAGGGLAGSRRERLIEQLEEMFFEDPASGVHGAALWALRELGGDKTAEAAEARLIALAVDPEAFSGKEWRYTEHGHCLVEIEGRDDFVMGSPTEERGRTSLELQRPGILPRRYLISAREISWEQFLPFFRECHAEVERERRLQKAEASKDEEPIHTPAGARRRYSSVFARAYNLEGDDCNAPDCPANVRSWYAAVFYCLWLSEREGMEEGDWCYEIRQVAPGYYDWALKDDYLEKRGYRLPTASEWEYACRSGATTRRHYGDSDAVLQEYAWYEGHSAYRRRPRGRLKPNGYGLFDCLGNIAEYCDSSVSDLYGALERHDGDLRELIPPEAVHSSQRPHRYTEARGGSVYTDADHTRPAHFDIVHKESSRKGFRIVRVINP